MIENDLKKRIFTSLFLLFLLFLIFSFNLVLVYVLVVLSVLSIIEFLQLTNKIFKKKIFFVALNFFFVFYVFAFSIGSSPWVVSAAPRQAGGQKITVLACFLEEN